MKERVIFGETSFWQEKQNEPLGDARFPFRMDQAGYMTIYPDVLVRADGYEVPLSRLTEWMWFSDRLPQEFYRQFAEFRPLPDAGKDDAPDATESAIRVLRGQYDRHGNY